MRKRLPMVLQGAIDLIVPASCWICETPVADRPTAFCESCERKLTADPHDVCPRCASTLSPFIAQIGHCPHCRKQAFAFDRVIRLGPYGEMLREAILRMKHPFGEAFADSLASLAAPVLRDKLQGQRVDGVIPIPLHWWKRWRRGYNQSEISARAIASALKQPLLTRVLFRTKWTEQQTAVQDRRQNVRGCFTAGREGEMRRLAGRTVLLVDDVLTSGATADEAARVLQTFGAKMIVAVLARASPREPL
ncbi:MAG TPA: ComF family protein [Gemmataceae bacterium]|jgi:ComF family protein|nr:ComF family protein [Gemmataceae bacterium]